MRKMNKVFYKEDQEELFQFGPGEPMMSKTRWIYEVGVHGVPQRLVSSELPTECPGLIGPDELAEWNAILNFANRTMKIGKGKAVSAEQQQWTSSVEADGVSGEFAASAGGARSGARS